MSFIPRCIFAIVLVCFFTALQAQEISNSQPPVWSSKPDVAAFEKTENDRLVAAQQAIDQVLAVKGARTIENTLVPFDDAIQHINSTLYFSGLMEAVHPDAAFRDHATAMTRKGSAVQTAVNLNRDIYQALASLDL
jgi:thimet oligopeptidase